MSRPLAPSAAARLSVDWTACDGRGLCAELLPELIGTDDWGYPVIYRAGVPASLAEHARRAVRDCPTLALRLTDASRGVRPAAPTSGRGRRSAVRRRE